LKADESEFRLPFFSEEGFVRKKCVSCGEFFWTQDPGRENCGDAPCQEYTFIGKPPTRRRYTLSEMRESFLSFFEKNGHLRIRPYPVIARWRDDLYVTIASIADFQPFVTDGVIPPPANPLVISQPCLRFTDIDKVGPTAGRHLTIFEMGGHHSFNYPEKQVYWKDETVRFHHNFMTDELGVKSDSIVYKEGMWSGGGNAGPDLEGSIDGLEVSTLVFMQYKVLDGKLVDMPLKVVDTGYGMERYTWLSQGALSGFHAVYGNVLEEIMRMAGLTKIEEEILAENAKLSGVIKVEEEAYRKALRKTVAERLSIDPTKLDRMMTPMENVYTIADHTRALTFMLAEGVVPSNVKVGYLARLLIRRAFRLLRSLAIEDEFPDVVETQIRYWSSDYPHLMEMRKEILEALSVEEEKYRKTIEKGIRFSERLMADIKSKGLSTVPEETLIELYDSRGIPPEMLRDEVKPSGVSVSIPPNFYTMVAERHVSAPPKEESTLVKKLKDDVSDLPETVLLYYEDPYVKKFEARVLKVIEEKYVVLDRTSFYPEGGGQPADNGVLKSVNGEAEVVDVQMVGNVVVHVVKGKPPSPGETVSGRIDWGRRMSLMRHHVATHMITGAARRVLGKHAWQAGAQKGVDRSRLDISHWARLTPEQVDRIEELANNVVMENVPIKAVWVPREEAEKRYGYLLYQGGVVPGRKIRVVSVGDWDVEACGGLYPKSTGEVGVIKIVSTERVQDGVERIVFSAGVPALRFIQDETAKVREIAQALNIPVERVAEETKVMFDEFREGRREIDRLSKTIAEHEVEKLLERSRMIRGVRLITHVAKDVDAEFLIMVGNKLIDRKPEAIAVLCGVNKTVRVVAMAGKEAIRKGVDAGEIAAEVAGTLGGGGGGDASFGQGGGVDVEKTEDALKKVHEALKRRLEG